MGNTVPCPCDQPPFPTMTLKEAALDDRILLFFGRRVIDATDYIHEHPGGINSLKVRKNQDITRDFYFHSTRARKLILSKQVATLSQDPPKPMGKAKPAPRAAGSPQPTFSVVSKTTTPAQCGRKPSNRV